MTSEEIQQAHARQVALLAKRAKNYDEIVSGMLAIAAEAGVRDTSSFYDLDSRARKITRHEHKPWPGLMEYWIEKEVPLAIRRGIDLTKLRTLADLIKAESDWRRARRKAKSEALQLLSLPPKAQEMMRAFEDARAQLSVEQKASFDQDLKHLVDQFRPLARRAKFRIVPKTT